MGGHEFEAVVAPVEPLDRGLVVQQRDDCFARLGHGLLADQDVVPVHDAVFDHAVPVYLEGEDIPVLLHHACRKSHVFLDVLFGENRQPGGYTAEDRDPDDAAGARRGGIPGPHDFYRAGLHGIAADIALFLDRPKVVVSRAGTDSKLLRDLPDTGWIPYPADLFAYKIVYVLLLGR